MRCVALALALSACGGDPVYTTTHGMAVYIDSERLPTDRDWQPLETALTLAIDYLTDHASRREVERILAGSELHLHSKKVECGGELKWGCYEEGGRMDAVGWTDCPTEWILHHELAHLAQEADGREQSHDDPAFGGGSWHDDLYDLMKAELRVCDRVPIY